MILITTLGVLTAWVLIITLYNMPGNIPYKAAKDQYPYRVTQKLRSAFALTDNPNEEASNWLGYFRFQDPTTMKPNVLTFPSINCFIPYRDKIVPRLGSQLLGAPYTTGQNWIPIGNKKRFGTMSGIEVEVRVTQTTDANLRDVIEVLYPNPVTSVLQWYQITLNTNSLPAGVGKLGMRARYYFDSWFDTNLNPAMGLNLPRLVWANGNTSVFSWTGGISPIGTIVANTSIQTLSGATWASLGFVDPNLDSNATGNIVVNGIEYPIVSGWETDTLLLSNTSGISTNDVAFSEITYVSTPISITGTITHGSIMPSLAIFQNGEIITDYPSGATATVTFDTAGTMLIHGVIGTFNTGDRITGSISKAYTTISTYTQTGQTQLSFDVCRQNNNYLYFGSWTSQKLYQSNGFNKTAVTNITNTQAVQNDFVLGTTIYNQSIQNVYRVTIDSTANNGSTFTGSGANAVTFNTVPFIIYTALVGTFALGDVVTGNVSGAKGIITGINVDSTFLQLTMYIGNFIVGESFGNAGATHTGTVTTFTNGYTRTGNNTYKVTFLTAFDPSNGYLSEYYYSITKNGVATGYYGTGELQLTSGSDKIPVNTSSSNPCFYLFDGISFNVDWSSIGTVYNYNTSTAFYSGALNNGDSWSINVGSSDTYSIQVNGGPPIISGVPIPPVTGTLTHGINTGSFTVGELVSGGSSGATGYIQSDISNNPGTMILRNVTGVFVAETITGSVSGVTTIVQTYTTTGGIQTIGNSTYGTNTGITFSFVSDTGHTLGDFWEVTGTPAVANAWANFYYTLPTRMPGEGYIYQLPSNFWAMAPQEAEMYVNTNYGEWSYVDTKLSSNLQSETVSLTPLKQAAISKVIFPYMINYLDNDIIYVTTDKKLDLIGRKQFVQLPQVSNLSQAVQLDFDEVSFMDGSMEYWDKKLWLTSPHDNVMLCYDNFEKNHYWQPPQVIPENGLLSIVGEDLISHSSIRNQTNTLFVGTSGDNGNEYTVRARGPYMSMGNRYGTKNSNASFVEGYISGNPPLKMNLFNGVNGCAGQNPHDIEPVVCVNKDYSPIGASALGAHQLGSDQFNQDSYFYEEYKKYNPILSYRLIAMEVSCIATNHSYSFLTMGLNSVTSDVGNVDLLTPTPISRT